MIKLINNKGQIWKYYNYHNQCLTISLCDRQDRQVSFVKIKICLLLYSLDARKCVRTIENSYLKDMMILIGISIQFRYDLINQFSLAIIVE
ncbi:hypothetical protein pb186bvf_002768 [Paramecium bursaria]